MNFVRAKRRDVAEMRDDIVKSRQQSKPLTVVGGGMAASVDAEIAFQQQRIDLLDWLNGATDDEAREKRALLMDTVPLRWRDRIRGDMRDVPFQHVTALALIELIDLAVGDR